jgi:polyribonucleotide 5'-hydroxyl-kinase
MFYYFVMFAAVKLGRTPILVDLDTSMNMLSVPGTIAASPMTPDTITPLANASCSIFPATTPLVFWNGSLDLSVNTDLYKAQLDELGKCIDERNDGSESHVVDARSSGIIVNGCGWIDDEGYKIMLHTVKALKINVVLVMGHDRLYSMLNSHYNKLRDAEDVDMESTSSNAMIIPKVIKLPRSGGIVSRDAAFRRFARSLCIKKYFYGESIRNPSSSTTSAAAAATGSMEEILCPPFSSLIHQFTPTRLEIPFADLTLYKLSSVSLSASMLPVSAKQATDPVQLTPVEISPSLHHGILAVCHPNSAEKFRKSGEARDLYLSGISGVVAVEKVNMDREIISLLSPGGSLPSNILLVGDVTWME